MKLLMAGIPICVVCDELPKEARIKRKEAARQKADESKRVKQSSG
jgi:hypothetical protein